MTSDTPMGVSEQLPERYVAPYPWPEKAHHWVCAACGNHRAWGEEEWPGAPKGDCPHCHRTSGQFLRRVEAAS